MSTAATARGKAQDTDTRSNAARRTCNAQARAHVFRAPAGQQRSHLFPMHFTIPIQVKRVKGGARHDAPLLRARGRVQLARREARRSYGCGGGQARHCRELLQKVLQVPLRDVVAECFEAVGKREAVDLHA